MKATRILTGIAALAAIAGSANAELAYGVRDIAGTTLVSFDTATPGTLTSVGSVTGIVAGHTLKGIDFRPNGGALYGISSSGNNLQVYTINLATGVATPQGATFVIAGTANTRISIDFNPVVDRLRIVTGSDQNARWNPVSNTFVQDDGALDFAAGDPNVGLTSLIAGIAYTNNFNGATSTTLYGYEYLRDDLITIGSIGGTPTSPNTGQMFTVSLATGIVANTAGMGMDISSSTGIAYLSADIGVSSIDSLYTQNLSTGTVSLVGSFGVAMLDISITIPAPGFAGVAALGGLVALRRRRVA